MSHPSISVYSLLMREDGAGRHIGGKHRHLYSTGARFWTSLLSTMAQVVGLVVAAKWLLPSLGVHLPWVLFLAAGIILVAYDVFTFVMGTRALDRDPVQGVGSMTGLHGVAVSDLAPAGRVRVQGELWQAKSVDGDMNRGTKVEVVGRESLVLSVRRTAK